MSAEQERVLVTGAGGFVGRHVSRALLSAGRQVRMLARSGAGLEGFEEAEVVAGRDVLDPEGVAGALRGCRAVVHLAARVHVMDDDAADPLSEFRRVNVDGTVQVARAAVREGVRRLVFVSTVKVNGEATGTAPFRETDVPRPADPYGISKWEAEAALREIAAASGLEVVVVRPPLVYGAGVRANFLRLLRLVDRGIPLPVGAVRNRRDLVFVRNLADAILACTSHASAPGNTFLVSDGEAVSTPALVGKIAAAMGRPARLFPVPERIIRAAGALTRRRAAVDRLLGSLEIDDGRIREVLGWSPPWTMEAGIRETVGWYRAQGAGGEG